MIAPDIRLALRLVRGAGRRDAVRLVAMALGVGFAVFAALVGIAAPRVSAQAHAVEVARGPVWGTTNDVAGGLRLETSNVTIGDQPWTRISVSGAGADSPLPPGISAWPSAGSTVVSPALRALVDGDPRVAREVGRLARGEIGSDGLTGPAELLSYSATSTANSGASAPGHQARAQSVVTGFGNPAAASDGGSSPLLIIEITILVLTPAVLFLVTALRLSTLSRSHRSFALGLAGMSPRRTAQVYAWEMSVIAAAGFGLGAVAYGGLQAAIGSSGLLGIRWWPEQGRLGWLSLTVSGIVALVVVRVLARRAMHRAASRTRYQRSSNDPRWTIRIAMILGLPATGFLLVVNINGLLHPSRALATDRFAAAIAAAVVASVIAVVLGVPGLIAQLGTASASRAAPAYALGLRGAAFRIATGRRLIAFVTGSIMLAGLSAAFLTSLHRAAFGDPREATVNLTVSAVRANPRWLDQLPNFPLTIEASVHGNGGWYAVVVGDCRAVERQAEVVFNSPGHCTDTVQRGSGGIGGASAHTLTLAGRRITVPPGDSTSNVTWDLKFPLRAAPWTDQLTTGAITYWVDKLDGSYQAVISLLAKRFPGVAIDAGLKDAPRYSVYRQQTGVVRAAATLGVWLSVCSFLLTALESRWERARSLGALAALGASRRTQRTANLVEFTFPILVAVLPAAGVGLLGGWAVLSFWGTDGMFSGQVPAWTGAGLLASIILAATAGWMTGSSPFRREALADS